MRNARFVLTLFLVAFGVRLEAAVVQELDGITYVRLLNVADPLPPAQRPTILDLRYVAGGGDVSALRQRLEQASTLHLVIYDPNPAPSVAALLERRQPKVLTLAPEGANPAPDLTLSVDPASDRTAYDAFSAGADLKALAGTAAEKPRFDEAALVRARNGSRAAVGPAASAAPTPADNDAAAEATAATKPPVDALLQHAVRITRGLIALGRT